MLELSLEERALLLKLVRGAVESAARGVKLEVPELSGGLASPAGAFVTLYHTGSLRGCIGTFDTSRPVGETVISMAEAAATRDTRFSPVPHSEVAELEISLSILEPARPARSLEEIEVGLHGLVVAHQGRRGVLLPKVATERGWSATEFLKATCMKARLDPVLAQTIGEPGGIEVAKFRTLDFSEADHG